MRYTDFATKDYDLLLEELVGQKLKRGDFIKNTYEKKWKEKGGVPGYKDIDVFIDKLGEVDPTINGAFMPWLAKMVISNPNENRPEDLYRVGEDLVTFEKNKSKIANKDINAYKGFQILYDVVAPFLLPREKTEDEIESEKQAEERAKVKGEIIHVYQGPEGWVSVPTSVEAAKFLGQNTRWCTAATNSNMFNHYDKDDRLFVIYDKATKSRFQLHLDSSQFADVTDKNLGFDSVPKWAWIPIIEWYKKTAKHLTLKQLSILNKFTDENLAKGSVHEPLLDLMKLYNV